MFILKEKNTTEGRGLVYKTILNLGALDLVFVPAIYGVAVHGIYYQLDFSTEKS